jgi:hypothetical protein
MRRAASHHRAVHRCRCACAILALLLLFTIGGCNSPKKKAPPPAPASRYQALKAKVVPDYLKGSIFERVYVGDTNPRPVSSFGLVANLRGTGDTRTSNIVREWMIKQMEKHGFGSRQLGYGDVTPEGVLNDARKRFAIVRVDGFIPAGARRGQRIDVQVSALQENNTTSLAGGQLYHSELKVDGANPRAPGMAIDEMAFAEGGIFVNPAYALERNPTTPEARASLRVGVVMGGGVVQVDRPILLRLVQPQYSMARQIEYRLDEFFQDSAVASAADDGFVRVMMPARFDGDWEHFVGLLQHVFFNTSPQFATLKAKQLAEVAVQPDAPLLDISYCWEALGQNALPFVQPLMTNEKPEIAFAAARACAFIGDASAQDVLIRMAQAKEHPFRLNAVMTLAALPSSPVINGMLRTLLASDQMTVRLEAYRALARSDDSSITTINVKDKFLLDEIRNDATPVIYAARRGTPRIAVIGKRAGISLPVTFTTMDGRLSISSTPDRASLTIFYRGSELEKPIRIESNPDIKQIAARLGGLGPADEPQLNFGYGEVVAILQALSDAQKVTTIASASPAGNGSRVPATFVLQEVPQLENSIYGAPVIPGPDQARPQGEGQAPQQVGDAADAPRTEPAATKPRPQEARK